MEFVVVKFTAGSITEWLRVLGDDGGEFGDFGAAGVAHVLYSNHQGWLEVLFTKNTSLIMSEIYATRHTTQQTWQSKSRVAQTEQSHSPDVSYDYSNIRHSYVGFTMASNCSRETSAGYSQYQREVHGSLARATMQIQVGFKLQWSCT